MEWLILAQVDTGNGWVAAVGTVGLLGPMLYWLCYVHLPAKDKQLAEIIAMKNAQIIKLIDEFRDEAKEARAECMTNMAEERKLRHTERQRASEDVLKVAVTLERNTQETVKLAQEVRALAGTVGNLANKVIVP